MTSNGYLSPSTLRELPGFEPYPARANFLPASATTLSNLGSPAMYIDLVNLRAAFRRAFPGQELTFAEAYRSFGMQVQRKREQAAGGPLAAVPGDSNHGWAKALDFRNNIGTYGSAEHAWMIANAGRFGFTPISSEAWHWEHLSDTAHTTITGASTGATELEDDDMTKDEYKDLLQAVKDAKNIAAKGSDRALKALDAVEALEARVFDPKKGVGYVVAAFVLSNGKSVSATLRTVSSRVAKLVGVKE